MSRSEQLFNRAKQTIPGGVNSPVRAFNGVGGNPIFIDRAQGAYIIDSDGKDYVDYIGSWGPMIMGHNHPHVKAAVIAAVENGLSYGAPTEIEIIMAERVKALVPSIEKVRMVSSGTEATMSAIRLARGFTGRDVIVKFEGCYHGHADSLLVKAGSGALTLGVPNSPGIPADLAKYTLTLEYNNIEQVRALFAQMGEQIACVIVEPVAGNMNCILPVPGFLETLREVCSQSGAVLIFDEVMTGFRVALGGAQAHYNIKPDLTTLGKVIGGGMPVGAFGGREDIMNFIAPVGPVYQAGTLSGCPVAMAAGLAALDLVSKPGVHQQLTATSAALCAGFQAAADAAGVPFTTSHVGGMFGLFFTRQEQVRSFAEATACDLATFKRFFHLMLNEGVYLAPSAYEAGFVSTEHGAAEITRTLAAAQHCFKQL